MGTRVSKPPRIGTCRLCLLPDQKLVESHIVPRSFFFPPGGPTGHVAVVSQSGVSKSPTGIYDYILCKRCEGSLSLCDRQAVRFAQLVSAGEPWIDGDGSLLGRTCGPEVRADLIKRFAQSVLFRAQVSTRPECAAVKLGPLEERLRQVILDGVDSEEFGVLVVTVADVLATPFLGFERVRLPDVLCWKFHVGGVAYYIKADRRPFPKVLRAIQVRAGVPVFAMHHETLNPRYAERVGGMLNRHGDRIERIFGRAGKRTTREA